MSVHTEGVLANLPTDGHTPLSPEISDITTNPLFLITSAATLSVSLLTVAHTFKSILSKVLSVVIFRAMQFHFFI